MKTTKIDDFLDKLPLSSVDDILKSVYDKGEKSSIHQLEEVLNKPFIPSDFLKSLTKKDALTELLYEKGEGEKIIFPTKGDSNLLKPLVGNIGDQSNSFHKENLLEHTSLVINNADKLANGKEQDLIRLTALLHDSGKKYTARTDGLVIKNDGKENVIPQISHPGSEKLSAYIAARTFKNIGIDKETATPHVAAIYSHNKRFQNWEEVKGKTEKKGFFKNDKEEVKSEKQQFIEKYGMGAHDILETLSKANQGILSKKDIESHKLDMITGQKAVFDHVNPMVLDITARQPRSTDEIDEKFYALSQMDEFEQHHLEMSAKYFEDVIKQEQERERLRKEREMIVEEEKRMVEAQRKMEQKFIQGASVGIGLALMSSVFKTMSDVGNVEVADKAEVSSKPGNPVEKNVGAKEIEPLDMVR